MIGLTIAVALFFIGIGLLFALWVGVVRLSTNVKLKAAKRMLGSKGPIIAFFHP